MAKNQSGLTLVEALIAIAVFAIFTLLINSIFFNILRASAKQEALKEVKQSGDFAMSIITNRIRNATALIDPGTGKEDPNCTGFPRNDITVKNPDDTSTEIKYDNLRIQIITDGKQEYITSSLVKLVNSNSLNFKCNSDVINSPRIQVYFKLEHINNVAQPDRPQEYATVDFQTSAYMRGQ